jgi:hypothetical protein
MVAPQSGHVSNFCGRPGTVIEPGNGSVFRRMGRKCRAPSTTSPQRGHVSNSPRESRVASGWCFIRQLSHPLCTSVNESRRAARPPTGSIPSTLVSAASQKDQVGKARSSLNIRHEGIYFARSTAIAVRSASALLDPWRRLARKNLLGRAADAIAYSDLHAQRASSLPVIRAEYQCVKRHWYSKESPKRFW